MAKWIITHRKEKDEPEFIEEVEVRVWGCAAKEKQEFMIGSGSNFIGDMNFWLEILYAINGVNVFYIRTILFIMNVMKGNELQEWMDKFMSGERDVLAYGDLLPETRIALERKKATYQQEEGKERTYVHYELILSADVGAVFAGSSPGERSIDIRIRDIPLEDGINFMRDFSNELVLAERGEYLNPAAFQPGSSDWTFAKQLNQKAYDIIAAEYQEDYFSNPLLTELFTAWLGKLPAGGHVLDVGCGHGDPIIPRLLEDGFRVSGSDLSSEMLKRAEERFPEVRFYNRATPEINEQAAYDGACSLHSLLYLDPIDLSHSLYRLYQAMKPGGLLFLFAYDVHPAWRGAPLRTFAKQWIWDWTYGMDEVKEALEEHGYFRVLRARNVTTKEDKQHLVAQWRKNEQERYESFVKRFIKPGDTPPPAPDLSKPPKTLGYCYAIIAQRRRRGPKHRQGK